MPEEQKKSNLMEEASTNRNLIIFGAESKSAFQKCILSHHRIVAAYLPFFCAKISNGQKIL